MKLLSSDDLANKYKLHVYGKILEWYVCTRALAEIGNQTFLLPLYTKIILYCVFSRGSSNTTVLIARDWKQLWKFLKGNLRVALIFPGLGIQVTDFLQNKHESRGRATDIE